MSGPKCPGQNPMFLKAGDIAEAPCPACGHRVEFWPDELVRKCPECGHRFANPENSMKCLSWCRYAAQCMSALREGDDDWIGPLREELIARMKAAFGDDSASIGHALAVLELAEEIGRRSDADPLVLVSAAILHDIGRAASRAGAKHGVEGRATAKEILWDLGLPEAVQEEILGLIEHHHDRERMDTRNGGPLFDADLIAHLRESGRDEARDGLAREALTEAGRQIGAERL